jgi:hypothetical protein
MENKDTTTTIEPAPAVATVATQTTTTIEPAPAVATVATETTTIETAPEPAPEPAPETVEARLDRIEALLDYGQSSYVYIAILFIIIACIVVFYLFDMNTFLIVMTTCLFMFGGV